MKINLSYHIIKRCKPIPTLRKTGVINVKVAILIPCYNEELTIEKVVKDWKKELPDAVVYVYDNNSTDRTVELAKKAGLDEDLRLRL